MARLGRRHDGWLHTSAAVLPNQRLTPVVHFGGGNLGERLARDVLGEAS